MTVNKTLNTAISVVNAAVGKNRIINGDMRIDQRNAGASVAPTDAYTLDRWEVREDTDGAVTCQQVADAPSGFNYSAKITVTTADSSLSATQRLFMRQNIEGNNVADLAFGTASAATVTLSFWVKSSLTGTFGGSYVNGGSNRSYPFTYSISSANTWEKKTVTVAGDTTGTWATDSSTGLRVNFGLGAGTDYSGTAGSWAAATYVTATSAVSVIGTLNATWQVTGVQLEVGSVATPFERRQYGQELALCQRYYEVLLSHSSGTGFLSYYFAGASDNRYTWLYKVTKRASSTVSLASGGSWGTSTPSIQGGADCATFYSTSYFTVGSTAGTPCIRAAAEL